MSNDDQLKLQAAFSEFLCRAKICDLINVHSWKADNDRAYFQITIAKPKEKDLVNETAHKSPTT